MNLSRPAGFSLTHCLVAPAAHGARRGRKRPGRPPPALTRLHGDGSRGIGELDACLCDVLGCRRLRVIGHETIKPNVHRLRIDVAGQERSIVAKWSRVEAARRNALVAQRWLPAVALDELGPSLLAVAAERSAERAWHVYDDLGGRPVSRRPPDPGEIRAAMEALARIHTALAAHPLLAECRLWGGDRGVEFFAANVRDAQRALRAIDRGRHGAEAASLRDALLHRMHRLREQQPERAAALGEEGGPETLVHGDLWTTNVLVARGAGRVRVRLIDWDEAAVGPIAFDLSTFLLRFEQRDRAWILDAYRSAVGRLAGWELAPASVLSPIFETVAYARLASLLVWSVAAALDDDSGWLPRRLAEMVEWLDSVGPVLPVR